MLNSLEVLRKVSKIKWIVKMYWFSQKISHKKVSKWTDDIKKDSKFCGIGTVNNQTHLSNGRNIENPCEDRSFSYEYLYIYIKL